MRQRSSRNPSNDNDSPLRTVASPRSSISRRGSQLSRHLLCRRGFHATGNGYHRFHRLSVSSSMESGARVCATALAGASVVGMAFYCAAPSAAAPDDDTLSSQRQQSRRAAGELSMIRDVTDNCLDLRKSCELICLLACHGCYFRDVLRHRLVRGDRRISTTIERSLSYGEER
jgi:hypothetical protein